MTPDIVCIYHANCMDGFTAAWAVRRKFGDGAEYIPAQYGSAPPDIAGRDVIIVDFSYKRPVLEEIIDQARTLLVLDHHKTAEEDLRGWVRPRETWEQHFGFAGAPACSHVGIEFDMNRSGAGMAWDYFHPDKPRPDLVKYVEDRDLWRFDLYRSRDANAYIAAHDFSFETWDRLNRDFTSNFMSVIHAGKAIDMKHQKDIATLVPKLRRSMVIGGHSVPVANLSFNFASDAGHLMCQPDAEGKAPPFAATYVDMPNGRVFSLRSSDAGLDVSEIAKAYGGGGHRNAAGFSQPLGWEGDNLLPS